MKAMSQLQQLRLLYEPNLPTILTDLTSIQPVFEVSEIEESLKGHFPLTSKQSFITFAKGSKQAHQPLRVGVVLSGGQAPGGHNVISGLYDALKKLNPSSYLIGFSDGPSGIIRNQAIDITKELLASYRNQGGFDIIGSGRTKIETPEDFEAAHRAVTDRNLDAVVIIGGDDSNTNAALLAEYFRKVKCKTRVIGVPKTIDGDLKSDQIEISFGFDTACKVYSEMIGNIAKDTLSAKKAYYFIKLMGRAASHVTLECALQTQPNLALISEEVERVGKTLQDVTDDIVKMIVRRAELGKDYGVILIPEGLIEFIPEVKQLITELNGLLAQESVESVEAKLSKDAAHCFSSLPASIQKQLLLDRDPHGNVQVSKIETERLLIELVKTRLQTLAKEGSYKGKFSSQPCFYGYEGRSSLPSNFDADYCYTLGHVAALLVDAGATGYICYVQNLTKPSQEWVVGGVPLCHMMHLEQRKGKTKAVIKKALVDLSGPAFSYFAKVSPNWIEHDDYKSPGPIQFFGPVSLTHTPPHSLRVTSNE